ncbi:hypothetical protein ACIRG4_07090 [Streptomyces sp. NPDC102395]
MTPSSAPASHAKTRDPASPPDRLIRRRLAETDGEEDLTGVIDLLTR